MPAAWGLLWLCILAVESSSHPGSHLYYSIDRSTRYVGDSPSLVELTSCK